MLATTIFAEKETIGKFLEVKIPTHISHLSSSFQDKVNERLKLENLDSESGIARNSYLKPKVYEKISHEEIHSLYPEREPALRISKAVVCNVAEEYLILAPFTVTSEMCAGHMPGFPILPLAEAGRTLAQVGAILISYLIKHIEQREGYFTPLVYKVGELISGQKGFLHPSDQVFLIAKARKLRGPLYTVEAHGYLGEEHIFSMPQIQYFVSEEPSFWMQKESPKEDLESNSIFLTYWFRIQAERIVEFQTWAATHGMNFWEKYDGIRRYRTFRPSPISIPNCDLAGKPSSVHGVSQVEAKSIEAIHKVFAVEEFRKIQEEFLSFVEPSSLQYAVMNCAYDSLNH
jgi:3-hydroxymyristoyl/3-hydroxydecanoyl-(acyl carrier protein) dehydratase